MELPSQFMKFRSLLETISLEEETNSNSTATEESFVHNNDSSSHITETIDIPPISEQNNTESTLSYHNDPTSPDSLAPTSSATATLENLAEDVSDRDDRAMRNPTVSQSILIARDLAQILKELHSINPNPVLLMDYPDLLV